MRDALIVGAGLAGSAAAIDLARQGLQVRLLERHPGPAHKVCGEFLSIEAQQHLDMLGIDLDRFGASHVDRMRVVAGHGSAEARLPFVARGLSRRHLDEALIARAIEAGVAVERPVHVLERGGEGVRTDRGERSARAVLLATGKIGLRGDRRDSLADGHVGFKMHWRLPPEARAALEGVIELTLFRGGYAGLQLVEGGTANVCMVLRRNRLAEIGGRWDDVLAMIAPLSPGLRGLAMGEPLFARPLTVANLPYGRLHSGEAQGGFYRLGDQAAMTASLTGDGMAIALRSGTLAAWCIARGEDPAAYRARLRAMVGGQMRRGMMLQRLAEAPGLPAAAMAVLAVCPPLLRAMVRMTRLPDWPHGDAPRCVAALASM